MKRIFRLCKNATCLLGFGMFALVATMAISCSKNDVIVEEQPVDEGPKPAVVSLSIVPKKHTPSTKATGANHGNQDLDNTVLSVDIFVFRQGGEDAGALDAFKRFEGDDLPGLNGLEVNATTGSKIIYAVANSHRFSWNDVKSLADFEKAVSSLKNEVGTSFTMVGKKEIDLKGGAEVELTVERLVARVELASLKTNFAGTPYEGCVLENVRVYLTNISAEKLYATGTDDDTPLIYNYKKVSDSNVTTCGSLIYESISDDITSTAYTTSHYFYCYENSISEEDDTNRFTRLVIQGEIDGTTYYYPININQEGFGYTSENDHHGVKRNTTYSLDVTICRPGSNDPDTVMELGALKINLKAADWVTIPTVQVVF